jgi:hypothetical protein
VKTRALLILCGASLALVRAAVADPAATAGAAPAGAADGLSPNRIAAIVRATGFDPMGRPVRNGDLYTVRALDPYDVAYRIVIEARTGRTVSINEIATPGPFQAMPGLRRGDGPVYGRIFGAPSDNYGFGSPRPPREVPHAKPSQQAQPQQAQPQEQAKQTQPSQQAEPHPQAQPSLRSAEIAPLPRPRPYVMESTGSIPLDAPKTLDSKAPEIKASATKPPAIEAPQTKAAETKPGSGATAMPPVAPLD